MTTYKNFPDAFSDFRHHGGAMNHDSGTWFVGTAEEIAEMVSPNTAREATSEALRRGGRTADEIIDELADWNEPASLSSHPSPQ